QDQAKIHHNPFYFLSPFGVVAYLVTRGILEPKFVNAFKDIGEINKSHAEEDVRKYVGNSQVIWHSYLRNLESLLNSGGSVSATITHEWKSRAGDLAQETGLDAASVPTPPKIQSYDSIAAATAQKNLSGLNTTGYHFVPLRPRTGNYIDLSKAERSFYVWYADFKQSSDGTITRENKPIPARNFILGAKKAPGSLTYYAVKLESRPNLPFLPGQFNSKLVAYAAAKPFGSQIGPPQDDPLFPRNGHYESTPNISFHERDSQGYQNPNIRRALASKILDDGKAPSREAIPVSRFPSLYEANRFIVGPEDLSWRQQWGGLNLIGALFSPRSNQFLTSWGPDGNKRLGYSVKLIPIEEILRSGNPPAEVEDLRLIRH
ncbi:MAG: hypothetical protein HY391_05585, partial [Deltaproteobacteria bacterium]|nr:hypothetical protein [Deltaproteobacteria bacterium]